MLIESVLYFVCCWNKAKIGDVCNDFFVLFSLGANVSAFEAMEGNKTLEGTIYVWHVFGEDSLVPREALVENGRSKRHPTHFLTESPEDEVVRKKRGIERHANT